jgi:hypothetical protein
LLTLFLPTLWCFLKRNCPNPTFWKAPHSHPCLLPHSIPSYMVMFPEEKLSKSCIQEAPHSQPCLLLLLAHSIPHYMVMFPWRKTVQILHSRRLHIHNNVFFFLTLFLTTWR